MLQMHSSSATQRITYKCLNSDPKGAVLLSSDFDKLETADKKQDRSSSARVDTFGDCKVSLLNNLVVSLVVCSLRVQQGVGSIQRLQNWYFCFLVKHAALRSQSKD